MKIAEIDWHLFWNAFSQQDVESRDRWGRALGLCGRRREVVDAPNAIGGEQFNP